MPSPKDHSLLSPSSSYRWLHCTNSPTFEAEFEDGKPSVYAEEGRLAHEFVELYGKHFFTGMSEDEYATRLEELKSKPLYNPEMLKTAEFFLQYICEKAMSFVSEYPLVFQETRVDFSNYVPEGFGTCDCIMIGGGRLHIVDYKHGKGVPVSAIGNTQMRLYALGALNMYSMLYEINEVSMAIVQPRITEDVDEDSISVDDLISWGNEIKPIAQIAYLGTGEFKSGDWCRFCKGKSVCQERAKANLAYEEFKDLEFSGTSKQEPHNPNTLTDDDVAELLIRAADLKQWYNNLESYALSAILKGHSLPGWKVVAGKSNREFTNEKKAFDIIKNNGFDENTLYETKPRSLSALEKLIGKKPFNEMVGGLITKPVGKPTLVPESDKRESYKPGEADFADLEKKDDDEDG